ncbi:hypothetical protein GQ457_04G022460 [Hibiscus cannabinus]
MGDKVSATEVVVGVVEATLVLTVRTVLGEVRKRGRGRSARDHDLVDKVEEGGVVVNASLIDSDIQVRQNNILLEAKASYKLGSLIGVSTKGFEQDIIKDLCLEDFLRKISYGIVMIQETKLGDVSRVIVSRLWTKNSVEFVFSGFIAALGGIIGWSCAMVSVYALVAREEQDALWVDLAVLLCSESLSLCVGSDFNMVRWPSERSGCSALSQGMRVFYEFIDSFELVDLSLVGKQYTWFGRGNCGSQIDRFLVSVSWLDFFSNARQCSMPKGFSYHCPLCDRLVDSGVGDDNVMVRLWELKKFLCIWIKEEFGNVDEVIGTKDPESAKIAERALAEISASARKENTKWNAISPRRLAKHDPKAHAHKIYLECKSQLLELPCKEDILVTSVIKVTA